MFCFDLYQQSTTWSVEFAPPGVNGLALAAMGAVTAGMSFGYAAQRGTSWNTVNYQIRSTANLNNAYQDMVSERSSVSEKSADLAFFLTREEVGRSLVGLDLKTGNRIGSIPMTEKSPQFQIDAIAGRVYHFANGNQLAAYDLHASAF